MKDERHKLDYYNVTCSCIDRACPGNREGTSMNDKPRSVTLQEHKKDDRYYYEVIVIYPNGKLHTEKTSTFLTKETAYGAALSIADNFTAKEMTWIT
jgi:hypothetical protein